MRCATAKFVAASTIDLTTGPAIRQAIAQGVQRSADLRARAHAMVQTGALAQALVERGFASNLEIQVPSVQSQCGIYFRKLTGSDAKRPAPGRRGGARGFETSLHLYGVSSR